MARCTPITGSKNVAEGDLLGPRSPARLSCSGQNLAAPCGLVYTQRFSAHRAAPDGQETAHSVTDDSQRTLINVKSLLFILTSREPAEVKKTTKTTKGI